MYFSAVLIKETDIKVVAKQCTENFFNSVLKCLLNFVDLKQFVYYDKDEDILNNLFLINYHMMPFNWNSDKAHNKWKRIFGDFKYQMLLNFHACDKARKNTNETDQN